MRADPGPPPHKTGQGPCLVFLPSVVERPHPGGRSAFPRARRRRGTWWSLVRSPDASPGLVLAVVLPEDIADHGDTRLSCERTARTTEARACPRGGHCSAWRRPRGPRARAGALIGCVGRGLVRRSARPEDNGMTGRGLVRRSARPEDNGAIRCREPRSRSAGGSARRGAGPERCRDFILTDEIDEIASCRCRSDGSTPVPFPLGETESSSDM